MSYLAHTLLQVDPGVDVPLSYFMVGFGVWLAVIVVLGYIGWNRTDTTEDLILARGDWGPIVLGFSAGATMASAATLIGIPGWVYASGGFAGLWGSLLMWPAIGLGLIIFAKSFRRLGVEYGSLSISDWLGHIYGSDAVRVVAALLVTFNGVWIVAQLAGVSQLVSGLTAVDYQTVVLACAVVVFGYTFFGGENAVQSSDFFQGILMIIVVALIVISGFWIIPGGLSGLPDAVSAQGGDLSMFSDQFPIFDSPLALIALFMFYLGLTVSAPASKKYLSLGDEKDMKLFIGVVIAVMIVWNLIVLSGLYAIALFPELSHPDQAAVQVLAEGFPTFLVALMAVAIFSATVSTVDSVVIALTVSYTNDIYRRVLVPRGIVHENKDISEERLDEITVWLSRAFMVLIGIVATYLALTPPELIATLVVIGNFGFISAVFAPVLLGIYWDKANAKGALVTLIGTPVVYILLFLFVTPHNPNIAGLYAMIIGLVLMVVVSKLTGRQTPAVDTRTEETIS